MILHPSKALLNALSAYEVGLYKAGYFPEVNYQEGNDGGFGGYSFNLFEKMDVGKLLFKCLDLNMIHRGVEYGAFSRQHGKKFISAIEDGILSVMRPVTSEYVKRTECQGDSVKLWGIEDEWNFREGQIVEKVYMDEIIFDVHVEDTNGNFDETGSAYIWEIAMIQTGSLWRPFHLSEEEKQIKKELYNR